MNETTNALEVLRERLQGNSRTLVVQLEPRDCAALVALVDQAIEERKRTKAELEAVHDEYRKATAPKPPVIWGVEGRFPRVDVSKAAKTLGCQLCGGHREHAPHCPSVDVVPREDAALSAPAPEPSERMMLVAEAVRAHVAHHIRTSPKFEGQLTTPADNGLLGRVAQDVENIDRNAIRAIVAKVVAS